MTSNFELVSIREVNIQKIRNWRNQQKIILRQNKNITKKDQEIYFNTIIKPSFK